MLDAETFHGFILNSNTSLPISQLGGTFTFMETADSGTSHIIKGQSLNVLTISLRFPN